VQNI